MLVVGLKDFRYDVNVIRMSQLAASFAVEGAAAQAAAGDEYERIKRLMDAGDAARAHGGGDILALARRRRGGGIVHR
jgi:hypothetical protein